VKNPVFSGMAFWDITDFSLEGTPTESSEPVVTDPSATSQPPQLAAPPNDQSAQPVPPPVAGPFVGGPSSNSAPAAGQANGSYPPTPGTYPPPFVPTGNSVPAMVPPIEPPPPPTAPDVSAGVRTGGIAQGAADAATAPQGTAGLAVPTVADNVDAPAANQGTVETPPAKTPQKIMTFGHVLAMTGIMAGLVIIVILVTMWIGSRIGLVSVQVGSYSPRVLTISGFVALVITIIVAYCTSITFMAIATIVLEGITLGLFLADYPHFFMQPVAASLITTVLATAVSHLPFFRLIGKVLRAVILCVISCGGVALINVGLYYEFGLNLGLLPGANNIFGEWAWLISLACVIATVVSLVDDFWRVDCGIQRQLPVKKAWVAAAGLAITPVWLYFSLVLLAVKMFLSILFSGIFSGRGRGGGGGGGGGHF